MARFAVPPVLSRPSLRAVALAVSVALGLAASYDAADARANPAPDAAAVTPETLDGLRALSVGEMSRMVVHDAPLAGPEATFLGPDGEEVSLAKFHGKATLVNFWAVWCPPCLKEMPSIDRLAGMVSDAPEDIAVVTVSLDRGGPERPRAFFDKIDVQHLALYRDPPNKLARAVALNGLPITILYDRAGQEVARFVGDAEWDSAEAEALLRRLASN